jgi:glucokinase
MSNILLVDVGGTNLRYAYAEIGAKVISESKKIPLESIEQFDLTLEGLMRANDVMNLVISVAGPKIGSSISMTNRKLVVDQDKLKKKFNLHSCFLLNDWESIGYSLANMNQNEIDIIKTGKTFNNNSFFIGPGTGLGAALLINNTNVLPTEIGNTTGLTKSLIKNYNLKDESDFITLENVVSGSAISKIFENLTGQLIKSEQVIELYKEGNNDAVNVINGFTKSLAEVMSDMALTFIAGNGVFFAGSLMRTIVELMDKELFIKHFIGNKKGTHKDLLEMIPIGLINREHACLAGNLNYFNIQETLILKK